MIDNKTHSYMKKIFAGILICCSFFVSSALQAQKAYEEGLLKHVGIGINAGMYGPGVNVNLSVLPFLKARVGLNYIGYTYVINQDFEGDTQTDPIVTDAVKGKIIDAGFGFLNASILADYYPFASVPFSITAGFYFGQNKAGVTGSAEDKFQYGGIKVNPNADGSFSGNIFMGNVVKPYLGIGFGRTISESRVGFRFDLGAIYQGSPEFRSPNIDGDFDISHIDTSGAESTLQTALMISLMKFWPQLSFSLTYRIF